MNSNPHTCRTNGMDPMVSYKIVIRESEQRERQNEILEILTQPQTELQTKTKHGIPVKFQATDLENRTDAQSKLRGSCIQMNWTTNSFNSVCIRN